MLKDRGFQSVRAALVKFVCKTVQVSIMVHWGYIDTPNEGAVMAHILIINLTRYCGAWPFSAL